MCVVFCFVVERGLVFGRVFFVSGGWFFFLRGVLVFRCVGNLGSLFLCLCLFHQKRALSLIETPAQQFVGSSFGLFHFVQPLAPCLFFG